MTSSRCAGPGAGPTGRPRWRPSTAPRCRIIHTWSATPGPAPRPTRSCPAPNPRQVTRLTKGNPDLEPSEVERISVGGEVRRQAFSLSAEFYRQSRRGLAGQNTADWAMLNLKVCGTGETTNCIERNGGDITIHNGYANLVDTEVEGAKLRFGSDFPVGWGTIGVRSIWQHTSKSRRRIAGETGPYPVPENAGYFRLIAQRGDITVYWTTNYRSEIRNPSGVGRFGSWVGHDVILDWVDPLGLEDTRVSAGVFNVTDAPLSQNTTNPSSTDGPTAAGWGRTFFVTFNAEF